MPVFCTNAHTSDPVGCIVPAFSDIILVNLVIACSNAASCSGWPPRVAKRTFSCRVTLLDAFRHTQIIIREIVLIRKANKTNVFEYARRWYLIEEAVADP
jgi:hypothetical protein